MKKLFVYYSLSSNGDVVSEEFKKKGYEIRKVITKKKYPNSMFFRILVGGYKASFNKKDKLLDFFCVMRKCYIFILILIPF